MSSIEGLLVAGLPVPRNLLAEVSVVHTGLLATVGQIRESCTAAMRLQVCRPIRAFAN